jgi:hypothetical protein
VNGRHLLSLIAQRHDIQGDHVPGQLDGLPDVLLNETGNDAGADI